MLTNVTIQAQSLKHLGTILIAVSNNDTRDWLKLLLETEGYMTVSAADRVSCMAAYQTCKPILILLDVEMLEDPESDCFGFLNRLTTQEEVNVIVLVSSHNYKELKWAFMQSAADYFVKPINHLLLLRRVRILLQQSYQKRCIEQLNYQLERSVHQKTSEMQQLDDRMRELLIYFTRAEQIKEDIIKNINYNIRTPLTSLAIATYLLKSCFPALGEKENEYFNIIDRNITEVDRVLESLNFLHHTSELLDIHPVPVDLANFTLELIAEKRSCLSPNYQLIFTNYCRPSCVVSADVGLWRQILTELLTNAIRFSPNGGTIKVALAQEPGTILLRVEDQGIGIPEADQPRVFEQFYRASNADFVPGAPGVGLGLSVVQYIVSLHKGKVVLHSAANRGTSVIVSIPCDCYTSQVGK